jgi:large subunit ribosomal protein L25
VGENVVAAEIREASGKGVARKLRAQGRIPAVVYGGKGETRSIHLDPTALSQVLHASGSGLNTLIDLEIGGASDQVLVKALDRDPVDGGYLHADFFRIDLTQKITVAVPLHFTGKAAGLEDGGILDHPVRELEISCLPSAIPEFIDVDVTSLGLNQSLHVSDLATADGLEIKTDQALAVAICSPPAAEEEVAVTEEVEGEEPEDGDAPAEEPKTEQ